MLIESEIGNLKVEQFEKGGLIFGMGCGLVQSQLEELYGGQLYFWPSDQNLIDFNELIEKTLFIPNILTHTAQREIRELLGRRRVFGINLVATIPDLESVNPVLSERAVAHKINHAIANLQTVIFTRCNQKLSEYLGALLRNEPRHFTNISLQSYMVEIPDRMSAPVG